MDCNPRYFRKFKNVCNFPYRLKEKTLKKLNIELFNENKCLLQQQVQQLINQNSALVNTSVNCYPIQNRLHFGFYKPTVVFSKCQLEDS